MAVLYMVHVDRKGAFMVKKLTSCLIIIFIVFVSSACAQEKKMTLELKDVQFFQAKQIGSSPLTIRLTGLVFHSSLGIRNVTTLRDNQTLQILVHLVPATAKFSGNLDYSVTVPSSIQFVTFGKTKAIIWDRDTGIVQRQ